MRRRVKVVSRRSDGTIALLIATPLPDLLEDDRLDFFSRETALLWLPRQAGLAWLLRC